MNAELLHEMPLEGVCIPCLPVCAQSAPQPALHPGTPALCCAGAGALLLWLWPLRWPAGGALTRGCCRLLTAAPLGSTGLQQSQAGQCSELK